jgi:tetratricopeptide (TPR) repeat protein
MSVKGTQSETGRKVQGPVRIGWIVVGLISITVLVYSSVGSYEFSNFDDPQYIFENPQVAHGINWSSVQWAFTTGHASNWHPLTWISHMVDVQLFGLQPGAHHYVNLFLHVLNTLLLFGFLVRTTGAKGRSALVAALFAVHPLHVESVVWISERKDVLSTLFFMLTLWAYAAYARLPGIRRYLLVMMLLALGLMSKPMLVTMPFLLLLLDAWPLKRITIDSNKLKTITRLLVEKTPLFALVAVSSVITFVVQNKGGAVQNLDAIPIALRLSNALVSYVAYIGNMAWPSGLAIMYPFPTSIPTWKYTGALVLLLATTIVSIKAMRRYPYLPVGWLWYLGTLVPVIGIVQVGSQALADRYTYIPLIGLFLIIAWGGYDLLGRGSTKPARLIVLCLLLLISLSTVTWIQSQYWVDGKTLWARALDVTTQNYRALGVYGQLLVADGRNAEAAVHFKKALEIQPANANFHAAEIHTLLGNALADMGQREKALPHYREAVRLRPDFAPTHNGLGNLFAAEGLLEEAVGHYEQALRIKPNYPFAHNGLGSVKDDMGLVDEAIVNYRKALESDPGFAAAHNNLAAAFVRKGQFDFAMEELSAALKYDPDNADYHYNFAILARRQGNIEQAREHLETVLRLKPQFEEARQTLLSLEAADSNKGDRP